MQINRVDSVDAGVYFDGHVSTPYSVPVRGIKKDKPIDANNTRYHRYPDMLGHFGVGGALDMLTSTVDCQGVGLPPIRGTGGYAGHRYTGSVYGEWPGFLSYPARTDGSAWAASAYAKMKPTKPSFSGFASLIELWKDTPEMLRQRFLEKPGFNQIGNYYLALKFGWGPLLQDVVNTVTFQRKAQQRLQWLFAHNGKPVRRRVDLASSSNTYQVGSYPQDHPSPGFVSQFYSGPQSTIRTRTDDDRVWACARFRYYLPGASDNIVWKLKTIATLYGLKPTPGAIWKVMPWSWLVDWFSNTGDILSNLDSDMDARLAADWFYVMRETKSTQVTQQNGHFYGLNLDPIPYSCSTTQEATHKSRIVGDPFGWATAASSLSSMQLSILGALGVSRLHF